MIKYQTTRLLPEANFSIWGIFFVSFSMSILACQNIKFETGEENPLFEEISNFSEIDINIIDSIYLENLESKYQDIPDLNSATVKELFEGYNQPETEIYQYEHISDFLKIDSLKGADSHEAYTQSLDIGMIRDAKAFKIGIASLGNDKKGALWGIWYSSYEACPYYHGLDLYLSVFENQKLKRTFKVGSNFSSVDPPVAVYNPISSTLNGSELIIKLESNEIDLMEDGREEIVKNQTQINDYQL
ncbi:hypothetical protein [Jiulongibacter sediminis]|uniref:Lipoprotein n=1 Tax=Jiulongibacter sediminis TaxID=1605367 RepID=A0A0P7C442_9BACT|nr:hypothetical protein [Jiulongibacter sediminis]KPM49430.1 hypothetical protein AFM12_02095 [Jiulongibacter sediminis]TBX26478.1 hypothetical protein TK44_02100 [Jiulongibacter sediminis]